MAAVNPVQHRQGDDLASSALKPMMWPCRIDVKLMSDAICRGWPSTQFGSFARDSWGAISSDL
jgi:hypothetical protein